MSNEGKTATRMFSDIEDVFYAKVDQVQLEKYEPNELEFGLLCHLTWTCHLLGGTCSVGMK